MNKIIYALREKTNGERKTKGFELLVPDADGAIEAETRLAFKAGQAIILPPMKSHALNFSGIRIAFENALLPFSDVTIIRDDGGEIAYAADRAAAYLSSNLAKKDLILAALGDLLTGYATAFAQGKEYSPVVETVRTEIAKGVSDCTFSIRDCLKRLPLNYDYIRKLFKKETGATPREWLTEERMKLAVQLIKSSVTNRFSHYTVSQIAEACGYTEPLYFSRVFKKYYGISPAEYETRTPV